MNTDLLNLIVDLKNKTRGTDVKSVHKKESDDEMKTIEIIVLLVILLIVAMFIIFAIVMCCKNCQEDYAFNKYMKGKAKPEIFVCGTCSSQASHLGGS